VKANGQPLLETYILDYDGDLYGRHVRVDFLHKFRDEQKFADLAALTREIERDVAAAREYFEQRDAGPRIVSRGT
jgi:riboflavin kinase/FMN adenylyltransferase